MADEDFPSGLRSGAYETPFATGLNSAITGFRLGSAIKTARQMSKQKKDFEAKTGVSLDLFVKLSNTAQDEILRNAGVLSKGPESVGIPDFGGRSMTDLRTQGAPGRTERVERGTGAFGGLGQTDVQVGPPLPPLGKNIGAPQMEAMNRYLGVEEPVSPVNQSLIESRDQLRGIRSAESVERINLMRKRGRQADASAAASRALAAKREKDEGPLPPWMVETGRRLGLAIPRGASVTKSEFDQLLKFNRPAQAAISRVTDLLEGAREAELQAGRELTDQELERYVRMQTTELPALAGPTAVKLVLDAVREQMASLRSAAKADLGKYDEDDEETVGEDDLPEEIDDDDEDPDYDEEEDLGYGR